MKIQYIIYGERKGLAMPPLYTSEPVAFTDQVPVEWIEDDFLTNFSLCESCGERYRINTSDSDVCEKCTNSMIPINNELGHDEFPDAYDEAVDLELSFPTKN